MDDEGITHEPEKRLKIAEKIIDRAVKIGISAEDVVIDPLVMAVSADPQAGLVSLETIRLVRDKLGVNMTQGSSNVSFGLPNREALNNAFMTLSIFTGVTCPIANPVKVTVAARSVDLLLGRDDFAMRFVEYFQNIQ
jgi:5-methyltetrahydrofolate--homocysteine methyltransferase